ncbi:hypothetical protein HDV62DRAFT_148234 [Trichoderma sp. SZMC 28011]
MHLSLICLAASYMRCTLGNSFSRAAAAGSAIDLITAWRQSSAPCESTCTAQAKGIGISLRLRAARSANSAALIDLKLNDGPSARC